jgi:hypothetical protein
VGAFFGGCGKLPVVFVYRVFDLPLFRNAQKRDKKIEQNNRGRKKNGGKKATFFVMSPDGFFLFFSRVFELPLLRSAQKSD